jgi:tetratricopeptide (TPR) repeat protein
MDQMVINRLRGRGCWSEVVSILDASAEKSPASALQCAALLVEQCMFTLKGWQQAEKALTDAEGIVRDHEMIGAVASERAFFAYTMTLLGGQDQSDNAHNALEYADRHLSDLSPFRPLLEFRRGLLAENLDGDLKAAGTAYNRAHAAAEANGDELLLSYTWRHLGSIAQQEGDHQTARRSYAESLRLREVSGFVIGISPALVALASVSPDGKADTLLSEARRLVRAFGGVPVWLAHSLIEN